MNMSRHVCLWAVQYRCADFIWMSHISHEWVVFRIIWMRHVTYMDEHCDADAQFSYKWVMSRTNESCLTWMSHVSYNKNASRHICEWAEDTDVQLSYEWVMFLRNGSCLIWMSHVTYEQAGRCRCAVFLWMMSHMNESCLIWMSHVSCEWVVSDTQFSLGVCYHEGKVNQSCFVWMSHVSYGWVMSRMDESCLICIVLSPGQGEWVMSPTYESFLVWIRHVFM